MIELLIGCPIYKRDWIFPYWISSIENQNIDLSKIGFIFIAAGDDHSTLMTLAKYRNMRPEIKIFEIHLLNDINHFEHQENSRQWSLSKYYNMVRLRNTMLKRVREIEPDYFFSLDSDILLEDPNTISLLTTHIQDGADAVSPLIFMTPNDTMYPGVMTWKDEPGGQAYRMEKYPLGTYFKSDIIMAAKMMSKKTYTNVDYKIHNQGEDLGWSANAAKAGLNLYCASYLYAPHIMHRVMIGHYLNNGDPRGLSVINN
jgi:hypothetical protein